jgi:hypothetical protein
MLEKQKDYTIKVQNRLLIECCLMLELFWARADSAGDEKLKLRIGNLLEKMQKQGY